MTFVLVPFKFRACIFITFSCEDTNFFSTLSTVDMKEMRQNRNRIQKQLSIDRALHNFIARNFFNQTLLHIHLLFHCRFSWYIKWRHDIRYPYGDECNAPTSWAFHRKISALEQRTKTRPNPITFVYRLHGFVCECVARTSRLRCSST